jgi:hypothetical protein
MIPSLSMQGSSSRSRVYPRYEDSSAHQIYFAPMLPIYHRYKSVIDEVSTCDLSNVESRTDTVNPDSSADDHERSTNDESSIQEKRGRQKYGWTRAFSSLVAQHGSNCEFIFNLFNFFC